jgi:tetratricopeptide (TPR) repeat protein
MLFLTLLVLIIFRTSEKQQNRPIAFGLLWFLFALVPTSSFIPLSEVTNDHRVFFPYVGLVLAITWPLARWILHQYAAHQNQVGWIRTITLTGVFLLFSAHSFGVVQRNKVWKTPESLWLDVTIKSPKNGRGLMNYGLSQMNKGNYQKALRYYLMALKTDYRNHPYLYLNMAATYDALGETENVEPLYKDAVRIGWNYPDCHYYYAKWLLKNNRPSEAEYYAKEALRISPTHEYAKGMLGLMNAQVGTLLDQAKLMVQQAPTSENYINLSLHYYRNNQFEECIKACEMALELRPNNADAYNNICSAYNAMGRWKEGIAACEKALAISPDYTLARNNLKWAKTEMAKKAQ